MEAGRRFSQPVCIIVHGNTRGGVWYCYPDFGPAMPVEAMARLMREVYPDRTLCLICCNPDGKLIHVDDVFFARRDVFTIPNQFAPVIRMFDHSAVGSISEFQN